MRILRDRSGVAAVEMVLLAPILITLMISVIDMAAALLSRAQIAQALATSAQYATLAGQNNVAIATIAANAKTYASALTNSFLGTPVVTTVVNNNAATGSKCCIVVSGSTATLSCSTSTTSCADGSSPGTYISVKAVYPFVPMFSADKYIVSSLTDTIVAPLQ